MCIEAIKKDLRFMSEEQTPETNACPAPVDDVAPVAPKRKHKLEIQIFDIDYEDADKNNGMPFKRPVRNDIDGGTPPIIEVADREEFLSLKRQYEMCGQTIEVIREIDPFDDSSSETSAPAKAASPRHASSSSPACSRPIAQASVQRSKPKIITIGDISVKYDGDKVYQKQWVKLTSQEAKNFRVVSDNNNKIINMNDKHLEAQRWVMIEDDGSDDSSADALVASI
jgi:hypothetical protein